MNQRLLVPVLALAALSACDRSKPEGGAAHADHELPGAQLHGQDDRGLVLLDIQDELHPGAVDFGAIELGDVVERTVGIENVEDTPITIETVTAGCSCTQPHISYVDASGARINGDIRASGKVLVIPPHTKADLTLRVDSRLSPEKNKAKIVVVRLTSDSDLDPYVTFEARMFISAAFQNVPVDIDLQRIGVNAGGEGSVEIARIGESQRDVVGVLEAPADVEVNFSRSPRQGIQTWLLTARVPPPLRLGFQERVIRLKTTGPNGEGEGKPYDVHVRWTGAPDVEVVPTKVVFVREAANSPTARAAVDLLSHMPGQRLNVTRYELVGAHSESVKTSIEAMFPDADGKSGHWRISLETSEPQGDKAFDGMLVIELDDAQFPRFEVPILRHGA